MKEKVKVCVTGAAGFVGKALCEALVRQGFEVHAIKRQKSGDYDQSAIFNHQLDIVKDPDSLSRVFEGADAVFHVASKVDMWGDYRDFYEANVIGTRNVLASCRQAGVRKLIYTSSPSVVADGTNLRNIDESYPVPTKHHAAYPATKAIAEAEVLAANCEELQTLALRPHLIFGPGDRHFIPTIIKRAQQGRMLRIGNGQNVVDVCFIEDCVNAHLLAYQSLTKDSLSAGKAFFISQGDPIKLWDFIEKVLAAHKLSISSFKVPSAIAFALANVFELIAKIFPGKIKPLFTRFLVSEMTTDHYFNIDSARQLLKYNPAYSTDEAIKKSFDQQSGS